MPLARNRVQWQHRALSAPTLRVLLSDALLFHYPFGDLPSKLISESVSSKQIGLHEVVVLLRFLCTLLLTCLLPLLQILAIGKTSYSYFKSINDGECIAFKMMIIALQSAIPCETKSLLLSKLCGVPRSALFGGSRGPMGTGSPHTTHVLTQQ